MFCKRHKRRAHELEEQVDRLQREVEGRKRTATKMGAQISRLTKMVVHAERENGRLIELNKKYLEQASLNMWRTRAKTAERDARSAEVHQAQAEDCLKQIAEMPCVNTRRRAPTPYCVCAACRAINFLGYRKVH